MISLINKEQHKSDLRVQDPGDHGHQVLEILTDYVFATVDPNVATKKDVMRELKEAFRAPLSRPSLKQVVL